MPVDIAFARHDFALLYDSFNRHGADGDFYLRLAETPSHILDIGCGTGSMALKFAERGHTVTGVDPAPGMLAVARAKPNPNGVTWIEGKGGEFALNTRFELIIMTGHVFQVFLDDAETIAVLANARRHLAPGGRLVFESRNPLARAWEGWTEGQTLEQTEIAGIGPVEVFYEVRNVSGEFVTFDAIFTLKATAETKASPSTLRFASRQTIARQLAEAGFSQVEWLGDWDGSPFYPESLEIITVARA